MKVQIDKKYLKYSIYAFITIFFSIVFFKIMDNMGIIIKEFIHMFEFVFRVFRPFIMAFAIAYLFNPGVKWLEKKVFFYFPMTENKGSTRIICIIAVYTIFIGITGLIITLIGPQLVRSIGDLINNIPYYVEVTEMYIQQLADRIILFQIYDISAEFQERINEFFQWIGLVLEFALDNIIKSIISITSILISVILGFIIAFYMLKDKEKFLASLKRILYIILDEYRARQVVSFAAEINHIFYKFIIGKAVDSVIIGVLCLVGTVLLNIQYAVLISIIIAATNMIPYFGPFIGAVPAVLIVLFESPVKALWVAIFIMVLQQFDGLILSPKILGDSVGLSPFWVIFSIITGGAFFGIIGMFLGVPIAAVLKLFMNRFIVSKENYGRSHKDRKYNKQNKQT